MRATGSPRGRTTAAIFLFLLMFMADTAPFAQDRPPAVPAPKWGTVMLPTGASLNVEVADTPILQERGYMFRESVPEGQGMIFLMGRMDLHPFWMKNCLTALDMLWMDDQWRVVHIEAGVPPCKADPCPYYMPMQKSEYILEVGPGQAAKLGLKLGDLIRYLPPAAPSK